MTRRGLATLLILLADGGMIAWGGAAALFLDQLPGPGGQPILAAGYEGFTGESWRALVETAPATAGFIGVVFRVYGAYVAAFGLVTVMIAATAFRRGEAWAWWALLVGNTVTFVSAMTYDRVVHAIGPFELTEYLGLALIYAGLALTAPFGARRAQAV